MRARVWGKAWVHLAAGEAALWRSGPRHTATEGSFSATPAEYLRAPTACLLALFYTKYGHTAPPPLVALAQTWDQSIGLSDIPCTQMHNVCTYRAWSHSGVLSSCQLLLTCINVLIRRQSLMKQTDTDNDKKRDQQSS